MHFNPCHYILIIIISSQLPSCSSWSSSSSVLSFFLPKGRRRPKRERQLELHTAPWGFHQGQKRRLCDASPGFSSSIYKWIIILLFGNCWSQCKHSTARTRVCATRSRKRRWTWRTLWPSRSSQAPTTRRTTCWRRQEGELSHPCNSCWQAYLAVATKRSCSPCWPPSMWTATLVMEGSRRLCTLQLATTGPELSSCYSLMALMSTPRTRGVWYLCTMPAAMGTLR